MFHVYNFKCLHNEGLLSKRFINVRLFVSCFKVCHFVSHIDFMCNMVQSIISCHVSTTLFWSLVKKRDFNEMHNALLLRLAMGHEIVTGV